MYRDAVMLHVADVCFQRLPSIVANEVGNCITFAIVRDMGSYSQIKSRATFLCQPLVALQGSVGGAVPRAKLVRPRALENVDGAQEEGVA